MNGTMKQKWYAVWLWLIAIAAITIAVATVGVLIHAEHAGAQEINPDDLPNPLNKVFFGARIYPESGPIRSMTTEVGTVKECLDYAAQTLAQGVVADAKAIEVRCIKERNAEKPS